MDALNKIWKDQADFNLNFFPPASSFEEQSRQTKEMVLHTMSELDELLRTTVWKTHRRQNVQPNIEQVKNELTDILKYWISLALIWGVTPEDAIADYWRKSMVCRQRYAEEYLRNLEGQIVICDIDGVLADYVSGFLAWTSNHQPELFNRCADLNRQDTNLWLNASSLGVSEDVWQELKHRFRTSRGKLSLPVYDGAKELLSACRAKGLKIVLLTSRPIDKYPNIYTDTLEWLINNELEHDFIWWSQDKAETLLSKNIKANVAFAIDDDTRFITSYTAMGIRSFWINRYKSVQSFSPQYVKEVSSLTDIVRYLEKEETSHGFTHPC